MHDDLVKRLREIHPEEFGDAWDFAFACQQTMREAANAIEELCGLCASLSKDCSEAVAKYLELWAKQPRWIPVTERLPTEDDYMPCYENYDGAVLWYTNSGVMGLGWYYDSTGNWSDMENCFPPGKVTHWMPIPKPPKEE